MKMRMVVVAVLAASTMAWGQDGGTLFKTKCGLCHGADGAGKPAMKAPKLAGTAKSADAIEKLLTQGGADKAPHIKGLSTLTPEQAKAIAVFVKTLK